VIATPPEVRIMEVTMIVGVWFAATLLSPVPEEENPAAQMNLREPGNAVATQFGRTVSSGDLLPLPLVGSAAPGA
jgi:hypothetical protein